MNQDQVVEAFQSGRIVGFDGRPLEARRALATRKSLLLFTDDLVLKMRRPRYIDTYNQSHLGTRHGMSARERWYGRRLNSGVYLEDAVLGIEYDSDLVRLLPQLLDGEPVVLMRRLPDALRADNFVNAAAPADARQQLELAMFQLGRFHKDSEFHLDPPFGTAARPRKRFDEMLARLGPVLDEATRTRLEHETIGWLEALAATLEHRVIERRVRTCHGELRLEHVFLPGLDRGSPLGFIDPHDGADSERMIDTAEEVMNLAIELDAVLGKDLSDQIVETYAAVTLDGTLRKVARLYKRLAWLGRAVEAVDDAAEPDADVAAAKERLRYFVEQAVNVRSLG